MVNIATLGIKFFWDGSNQKGEEFLKIAKEADERVKKLQESLNKLKTDDSYKKLAEDAKKANKYLADYSKAISTREGLKAKYDKERLPIIQDYLRRRKENLTPRQRGMFRTQSIKQLRDLRDIYGISPIGKHEKENIESVYQSNLDKIQNYEETKEYKDKKESALKKDIAEQKKIRDVAKKNAREQNKRVYDTIKSFTTLGGITRTLVASMGAMGMALTALTVSFAKAREGLGADVAEETILSKFTGLDNAEIERRATALESMGVYKNENIFVRRKKLRDLVSKMEIMSQDVMKGQVPSTAIGTGIDPARLTSFEGIIEAINDGLKTPYNTWVRKFVSSEGLSGLLAIPEGTNVSERLQKSFSGVSSEQLENANRATNVFRPLGSNLHTLGKDISRGVWGKAYEDINYAKNVLTTPSSSGNLYYYNNIEVNTDNTEAVKEAMSDKIDVRIMMDNGGVR